jgi:hypothetical protein
MTRPSTHTPEQRPPTARKVTAMQIARCAELRASMLAQRGNLRRERALQARAMVRAGARMSAAGHLPLQHHTARSTAAC